MRTLAREVSPVTDALAKIDVARRALAEARSVADVKDIRDKAAAIRSYYQRQRDGSLEARNHAAELVVRAERKLGELLADQVKHKGRPAKVSHDERLSNGTIPE